MAPYDVASIICQALPPAPAPSPLCARRAADVDVSAPHGAVNNTAAAIASSSSTWLDCEPLRSSTSKPEAAKPTRVDGHIRSHLPIQLNFHETIQVITT